MSYRCFAMNTSLTALVSRLEVCSCRARCTLDNRVTIDRAQSLGLVTRLVAAFTEERYHDLARFFKLRRVVSDKCTLEDLGISEG